MEVVVQQELEDAEFIPMPGDCDLPTPDQLLSFSESVTLPYAELKELKAAAAAVSSTTGLSVMQKSFLCTHLDIYYTLLIKKKNAKKLKTLLSSYVILHLKHIHHVHFEISKD